MERLGEVWAADITYVPTDEGWLYLAGVLDLGNLHLMGWAMDGSPETSLPMDAIRMALRQRQPSGGLLHHSDRGCHYASEASREHLAAWNVTPSMSRKGNCYDNAAMESFWATLKTERDRRPSVRDPRRSQKRALLVHRSLLQPSATPRGTRFSIARGLLSIT